MIPDSQSCKLCSQSAENQDSSVASWPWEGKGGQQGVATAKYISMDAEDFLSDLFFSLTVEQKNGTADFQQALLISFPPTCFNKSLIKHQGKSQPAMRHRHSSNVTPCTSRKHWVVPK